MKACLAPGVALLLMLWVAGCSNPPNPADDTTRQQQAAIETALPRLAEALAQQKPGTAAMTALFEQYLRAQPAVYGVAFAPAPPAAGDKAASALYVYRRAGVLTPTQLTPPQYNYLSMEWYNLPRTRQAPAWTAPYFDRGGGNIWMMTYSFPIYLDAAKTQLYGIVTSDLPVPTPK